MGRTVRAEEAKTTVKRGDKTVPRKTLSANVDLAHAITAAMHKENKTRSVATFIETALQSAYTPAAEAVPAVAAVKASKGVKAVAAVAAVPAAKASLRVGGSAKYIQGNYAYQVKPHELPVYYGVDPEINALVDAIAGRTGVGSSNVVRAVVAVHLGIQDLVECIAPDGDDTPVADVDFDLA